MSRLEAGRGERVTETALNEFLALVKKNLTKNGFPQNAVSFGVDRMYEEADRRGFSFNKVRDALRTEGIESELVGEKVVFTAAVARDMDPTNFAEMRAMAEEILGGMSSEEREKLMKMAQEMDPSAMEAARKHWESLSPDEQRRAMQEMRRK
jgi:hypothetical protein